MKIDFLPDKFAIIDGLPLFSNLSRSQKLLIASKCQIVQFEKGKLIYDEGDKPDYFYCVISGRVEIFHPADKTKTRRELRLESLRRGEYFGSISSMTGHPHTVSARALNDSILAAIDVKNFDYIIRRIPQLAISLTSTLHRRLSQKPLKEIFESAIIAVYGVEAGRDSSAYAVLLAESLSKESGKKVTVIKSDSIASEKAVAPRLSLLAEDYHYLIVDAPAELNDITFEALRQADIVHIITPSEKKSLYKTRLLIKQLKSKRNPPENICVIVKVDALYGKTSYEEKTKMLGSEIFASLPQDDADFKKAARRIARQISGVTVGLALGSGGAIGLAHIGVLKVFEEEKIPVDVIAGTSIGSFIAALWAAGYPADEIAKLAYSYKSKLKTFFLVDLALSATGLIKGKMVRKILTDYLGNKTFFDLRMPLKVIACDIKKRAEFVIDKGSVVDAVMASIAIPGVFPAVEYGDIQLVDGGIVSPLPVSILSKAGVKRIIAVNTLPSPEDVIRVERKLGMHNIIANSLLAMEYVIAADSSRQADICINPIPKLADWYEFYKAGIFVKTGEEHARKNLADIKKLIQV